MFVCTIAVYNSKYNGCCCRSFPRPDEKQSPYPTASQTLIPNYGIYLMHPYRMTAYYYCCCVHQPSLNTVYRQLDGYEQCTDNMGSDNIERGDCVW